MCSIGSVDFFVEMSPSLQYLNSGCVKNCNLLGYALKG